MVEDETIFLDHFIVLSRPNITAEPVTTAPVAVLTETSYDHPAVDDS